MKNKICKIKFLHAVLISLLLALPVMSESLTINPNDPSGSEIILLPESEPEIPYGSGAITPPVLIEPSTPAAAPAMRTLSLGPVPMTPTIVNGNFETGDLTGWGVYHAGYNGGWYPYSGTTTPLSLKPIAAPPERTYAATSDQTYWSEQILYQDISLPESGRYRLHMNLYYHNWAGNFVTPDSLSWDSGVNQQYRVDLVNPAAPLDSMVPGDILANVFRTKVDDPLVMAPTPVEFDLSEFAGRTIRLRFAQVCTELFFNASVDNVRLELIREPGVSPRDVTEQLIPGGSISIAKTVLTPPISPKADIYFLADTTGSMSGSLANVQTNATSILAQIAAQANDPRFGAGNYRDFPYDPYAFSNDAVIGEQGPALTAIATWSLGWGADGPEAQLYALDQIANGLVGWRDGSNKIVVWFGDWPGHDSVCQAISGLDYDITEKSVTDKLVAAGIKVIAISVNSGAGLDLDPKPYSYDYVACGEPGGAAGQATRIANATGGVHLTAVSPDQVSAAIISGLTNLPVTVTPQIDPACSSELTYAFDPTTMTVTSGEAAIFGETIGVAPAATAGLQNCTVNWLIGDVVAGPAFAQSIAIDVHRPVADAGGPYTVDEGAPVTLDASNSWDAVADHTLEYAWDLDNNGTFETPGKIVATAFNDNGIYNVGLQVIDSAGASDTTTATVTVNNVAPAVTALTAPAIVAVNTAFTVSATIVDPGTDDTHINAECNFGDGGASHVGDIDQPADTVKASSADASHTDYIQPGIYTITMTLMDDDGGTGSASTQVVAYDPSAGFVTGGGWIDSPAGAYKADLSLAGKANFGFVSKYQKGATKPTGQTEFNFQTGNFNFHSSSYDWLVVTGGNAAQYKGSGTVNGSGEYRFMLWAGDGAPDTFRIRIWTEDGAGTETDVYDNASNQPISGGTIVIHSGKTGK